MKNSEYNPQCWYRGVCDNYTDGCEENCVKYKEMKFLMENSNIPVAKRVPIKLTPPAVDYNAYVRLDEIRRNIYDFVFDGKSLYITSNIVGNGKTSFALKLLMKYFEEMLGESEFEPVGLFIHVPTFLAKCKDFKTTDYEFEQLKKRLLEVDLVVWDDIASTDVTSYDISQLNMYIDSRNMNELSNIYTGNITDRGEMNEILGARLTSRIWNSNTEVIEFKGGERR